jgi:alanyl-tRNA synthetase
MTDRLYYTDPYNLEFDAVVRRIDARGGLTAVFLDRSCFYPTTGGQPFDTGTLGGHPVVDVVESEDGDVAHLVESAPSLTASDRQPVPRLPLVVGQTVHGAVDWPRRFDHMQQHTGQHVLSAAFDRLFGVRTVSFHLGAQASTIDLAREVTPRELAAAEDEANRIVWENRPVGVRFVTPEEAAALPLRKEPVREGTLRLVEVRDFDLSACGGTHVTRTGEIGVIAVAAWERFKGGQRLEFLCGRRALDRLRSLRDATAASAKLLSVQAEELPGAIDRLLADARDHRRAMTALQADVSRYRAEELAAAAEPIRGGRLAARALDGDAGALKHLAAAIVSRPGFIAVLVSTARPALVVVARSADVDAAANAVLSRLTAKFGGRGGGKSDLAQGGGLDAPADEILAEARAALSA